MAEAVKSQSKLKIALAISLALNLCVAGVVAGVMLRDGPPQRGGYDFGLGPLSEALDKEDRKASDLGLKSEGRAAPSRPSRPAPRPTVGMER